MTTTLGEVFWAIDSAAGRRELMLSGQRGTYVRSGGAWWRLPVLSSFLDGLTTIPATDNDIRQFDAAEMQSRPDTVAR